MASDVDKELVAAAVELSRGAGVVLVVGINVMLWLGVTAAVLEVVGGDDVVGEGVNCAGVLVVVQGAGVVELELVAEAVEELIAAGHGLARFVVKMVSCSIE